MNNGGTQMTTKEMPLEPWTFTDYYFKNSMAQELMDLTEEAMKTAIKDAKLRTKIYVHPEMVDTFLALLAKSYHEEEEEAFELCATIGLTKRHMDAIRDDYKAVMNELEDDYYNQGMEIRYLNKVLL
jgi:hypothetical protein